MENRNWKLEERIRRSRSLHCAAGARVRERRKKPAAPVGMTIITCCAYVGAEAPTPREGTMYRAPTRQEERDFIAHREINDDVVHVH